MYQRLALSAHYLVRLSESELQEPRWYIPRPYLPNLFLRLPGNDMVDFGGHQRIEKVPFEVLHKCTFPPRESNPYSPYMQIWHFFPWRLLAMTQSLSAVIRESKGFFSKIQIHIYIMRIEAILTVSTEFQSRMENSGERSDRKGWPSCRKRWKFSACMWAPVIEK